MLARENGWYRKVRGQATCLALEDFCSVRDCRQRPSMTAPSSGSGGVCGGSPPIRRQSRAAVPPLAVRLAHRRWRHASEEPGVPRHRFFRIQTVRLAPLYDSVTTRVFPGLAGDRMALKLNGRDDRLTPVDFSPWRASWRCRQGAPRLRWRRPRFMHSGLPTSFCLPPSLRTAKRHVPWRGEDDPQRTRRGLRMRGFATDWFCSPRIYPIPARIVSQSSLETSLRNRDASLGFARVGPDDERK